MNMDSEPSTPTQSSYFASCMASPAWLPAARRSPARFHLLSRDGGRDVRRRAWRRLLMRLLRESKSCICSPRARAPPMITFGYDAASYAKNFDDGRRPSSASPADNPGPGQLIDSPEKLR